MCVCGGGLFTLVVREHADKAVVGGHGVVFVPNVLYGAAPRQGCFEVQPCVPPAHVVGAGGEAGLRVPSVWV